MLARAASLLVLCSFLAVCFSATTDFRVGVGIYDVTGPPSGVNMMGMGQAGQRTHGVHFRLRSRAFIFEEVSTSKRVVYVTNNLCMTYSGMVQNITALLQQKYGNLYTYENIMISGEHTHSGPAGFTYMSLYDITSFGFQKDNFLTIVNGIVNAISMAHDNMTDARIYINNGTLLNTSTNRSPYSYQFNPNNEQQQYDYNTDKNMTILRIEDSNGNGLGLLSWFAVHGTSMNNTNELISGDNKGFASLYVEQYKNGNNSLPGMGPFIAGFAQCNEGDVSPNIVGAFCPDGTPCDPRSSTCIGADGKPRVELCRGYGPGSDMFEATKIIGTNQAKFALHLYDTAVTQLQGYIAYVHTWINAENITVSSQYTSTGKNEKTCPAALGDSFAAGTTDGAGDFNFVQGTNDTRTNKWWNRIAYTILSEPTQEEIDCQAPKPILLNLGDMKFPAPWAASIVPIQIFKIGQVFLIGVPGEFTTMAGRRLRNTVRDTLQQYGLADANSYIIISGLSNEYTHYITTYEEYQIQRYEAASTLYGPHTLAAYQQEFTRLITDGLAQNVTSLPGPTPPNLNYVDWCLAECDRGPDGHPVGESFGSIETDVAPSYKIGDQASVTFWGANLNHNFMTQSTYLTVDYLTSTNQWTTILVDGHWETKLHWQKHEVDRSLITVEWDIQSDTTPGTYRLTHQGYYKEEITGHFKYYQGISSSFTVTA